MSVRIELLRSGEEGLWDDFAATVPGTQMSHTTRWRDFLAELLDAEPLYLKAVDEAGNMTGALPGLLCQGPLGPVLNSLPFFGSNGGIVARPGDARTRQALLDAWRGLARERGCAASTIIDSPFLPSLDEAASEANLLEGERALGDFRLAQTTSLTGEADPETNIMKTIAGVRRQNIRKAEASGIEVAVSYDAEAFAFLEATHRENMAAIGGRPKPEAFFRLVRERFEPGRECRLYLGLKGGEMVCALLLFVFRDTVEYFMPVIKAEHRPLQPQSLVIFTAMADAAREGRSVWNWGGTWGTQGDLYRFKKKWGAVDRPYAYHTVLYRNADALVAARPEELLHGYPYFYVMPFHAARASEPQAAT